MACTFAGYQVREMMLDPRVMALALGGHVRGCNVLAPGPGHSRADRSLSIKIDPCARDGFIVHSFTGDPTSRCREHVRTALNLSGSERQPGNLHRGDSRPLKPHYTIRLNVPRSRCGYGMRRSIRAAR